MNLVCYRCHAKFETRSGLRRHHIRRHNVVVHDVISRTVQTDVIETLMQHFNLTRDNYVIDVTSRDRLVTEKLINVVTVGPDGQHRVNLQAQNGVSQVLARFPPDHFSLIIAILPDDNVMKLFKVVKNVPMAFLLPRNSLVDADYVVTANDDFNWFVKGGRVRNPNKRSRKSDAESVVSPAEVAPAEVAPRRLVTPRDDAPRRLVTPRDDAPRRLVTPSDDALRRLVTQRGDAPRRRVSPIESFYDKIFK